MAIMTKSTQHPPNENMSLNSLDCSKILELLFKDRFLNCYHHIIHLVFFHHMRKIMINLVSL